MEAASNVAFAATRRPVFPLAAPMTLVHTTSALSTTAIDIPGTDTRSMNCGSMARNASDGIHERFSSRQGDAWRGSAADIAVATARGAIESSSLRLTDNGLRRSVMCHSSPLRTGIEDHLQQLSELPHSDCLRSGRRPWQVCVDTVHDDDVEGGDDHDVVTPIPLRCEASVRQARAEDEIAVRSHPPEISIACIPVILVLLAIRDGVRGGARPYPLFRDDLLAEPCPLAEVQEPEPRHIACCHVKYIRPVYRLHVGVVVRIGPAEVFHLKRHGDPVVEQLEDGSVGYLLQNRSERVEVPVVVIPVRVRWMRPAHGLRLGHARRFIDGRVVDTGTRLQEVDDAGQLLVRGKRRSVVIDPQILQRAGEINRALADRDPIQRTDETLADRMDVVLLPGIAPFADDQSVIDDHDRGRIDGS